MTLSDVKKLARVFEVLKEKFSAAYKMLVQGSTRYRPNSQYNIAICVCNENAQSAFDFFAYCFIRIRDNLSSLAKQSFNDRYGALPA
jgi:hypothetical protein